MLEYPTGILLRFFENLSEIHQGYCEDSSGILQEFSTCYEFLLTRIICFQVTLGFEAHQDTIKRTGSTARNRFVV